MGRKEEERVRETEKERHSGAGFQDICKTKSADCMPVTMINYRSGITANRLAHMGTKTHTFTQTHKCTRTSTRTIPLGVSKKPFVMVRWSKAKCQTYPSFSRSQKSSLKSTAV